MPFLCKCVGSVFQTARDERNLSGGAKKPEFPKPKLQRFSSSMLAEATPSSCLTSAASPMRRCPAAETDVSLNNGIAEAEKDRDRERERGRARQQEVDDFGIPFTLPKRLKPLGPRKAQMAEGTDRWVYRILATVCFDKVFQSAVEGGWPRGSLRAWNDRLPMSLGLGR